MESVTGLEKQQMFKKSYRLKVAAWSAMVSGIILLGFMILTTLGMREEQWELVEYDVGALASFLLIELTTHDEAVLTITEFAESMTRQAEPQILVFAVKSPYGQYLYRDDYLWKDEYFDALETNRSIFTIDGEWRIRHYKQDDWHVYLGNKLEDTEHEYIEMVHAYVIALPLCLLFIAAGGWWIAWHSLRPIQAITKVISEVQTKDLSKRVPDEGREDEIGLMAQSVNQMLDRFEHGYIQARKFTADASHELRTPLAILQAELENRLGDDDAHEEDKLAYVRMLEEVRRLKTLTHTLLFLTRVDTGIVEIEQKPVPLVKDMEQILDEFRELPETENLTINLEKTDSFVEVRGESRLLRQIIYNMVQNAVKFNRPGGKIECRATKEDTHLLITIGNNGHVIAEKDQDKIFDRFYCSDMERDGKTSGSGLGLNLAREITRLHNGSLKLVSSKDDWTEISLRLPLYGF